ncbi:hypothetical protein TCAL_14104 [Tigriopus californicus]|uniref:HAT C-terminal dimerisation domain-containing protein n=2 Tax=Tigriopus californicus TaxID=6832 RepID=A0A553P5P8_TIGCA|nr:hypothetical protein TCAL_14104 [Tigriopus californicus]|eukprot:TCALIF_14104-PA protein Name:"Similar to ZBED4 Zinc finger BED domain-containing protein 4 (Homo sapiens)" AED:0.12 eAED:0.12 QI:0/-1/0/1/-1/1/1/0/413
MDCSRIKGSHTAQNLRSKILTTLVQYKVEKKIVCAISDKAANIQKALGTLSFPHQPCYSHLLNLVVKKSLSADIGLQDLIKKVSNVVTYTHHSTVASDKLEDLHIKLGSTPKKLKAKVETRWNSTFMMLERFLESKNVLTLLFADSFFEGKSDSFKFSHSEWDSIQDMVHCLSHIYEATQEMGGEKHTTIGKTIPMTTVLMKAYQEEVEESKTTLTIELAQEILKYLHLRFGRVEFDSIYTFSTLLDPRYQNCMFRSTDGLDQALTELKEELKKGSIVPVSGSDIPSASYEGVLSSQASKRSKKSLWTKMDREVITEMKDSYSSSNQATNELHLYLTEVPRILRQSDPLNWWVKVGKERFPHIYQVAIKYLVIPATSVPSERLFSSAGDILREKRSNLGDDIATSLICLHANL